MRGAKRWLISTSALVPLSLGLSEPALAQTFGPGGNDYPGGISSNTDVTLLPGVQVFVTPGTINQAVAISTGTAPGTGAPATLTANNAAVTISGGDLVSALFLHPILGNATITASGIMNVAGTGNNTNAIWAATFSSVPGAVASVTYTGSATPGIIDINATGGSNSSLIQACANAGCGFSYAGTGITPPDGNAIINATGNLTGVFGNSGFGLTAVAGGNGTATVNYNGGTINLTGGSFSDGIFATGGSATITTLPGTTIIVSSTSAAPTGVEAFAGNGAATATVASTILINGNPAPPTTNYKSNPTGIRAQSDLGGDVSVTSGPSITVHGGGGLGIVAVSGSSDNTTASGSVTVNASGGPIIADGSNAVGILADSGFIRNVFSSGGRAPTTITGSVDVTASNVSALGQFGTAISATGGSGGVTVNIPSGGLITGGWQPDVTSVGVTYGLRATGVVLGSAGGGTATLNNFGSIGALSDRAVASPLPSFMPNSTSSFPTSNNTSIINNGTITGFVELVGGNNSILNNGTFNLRHFADTDGDGVRDTLRVAIADLGNLPNNKFTNNGTLALPAVTGATTLDSTGQYLPLGNPNNAMALGGPLQGHLIGVQTFTNSGTIDLQSNPVAGDVLVITGARQAGGPGNPGNTGTFISDGGMLRLDTVLNEGGAATRSDTLVVDGTSVGPGGATQMAIRNAGGQGALTVGDGILLVQVTDPNRSASGAFSLAHPLSAGAFDCFLFKGGASPGSQGNWYLRNEVIAPPNGPLPEAAPGEVLPTPVPGEVIPLFRADVAVQSVLPTVARELIMLGIGTFNERQGDQLLLRDGTKVGAWGRVFGQHKTEQFAQGARPDFDGTFAGFQVGSDLWRFESANGHSDHIGFYVTQSRASGSVHGLVDGFAGAPAGHVDLDASSYGAYWTHLGPSNWYIDTVVQGSYFLASPSSINSLGNNFSGSGYAASIEAGYPIALASWLVFEPQIQAIWQRVSFNNTADPVSTVTFDNAGVFTGRAGALLRGTFGAAGTQWQPYLKGNVWWGTNGFDTVTFGIDPVQTGRQGGTTLEGGGGVTGKLTRYISVYGDASYLTAVSGETRNAIKGNVGLRVAW